MNRSLQRTLMLVLLGTLLVVCAREARCANTYYVRGSHSYTINTNSTEIRITLVRTSGRDSADIAPTVVRVRGTSWGLVNDAHFKFSRYSFDSLQTVSMYFYTAKYRDTSVALLLIPLGSVTDTIRFTGTDPRIEPPMPNGNCFSMWVWGQNLTLGSLDSSQDPSTYNWDYSYDYSEMPGGVSLVKGASTNRVHLWIVGSPYWYFRTQSIYDSLGLGSVSPQELYTNASFQVGYRSHGVAFDTALIIAEAIGGSCSQRDTIVIHMHDILPAHIWQKLSIGPHDIGEVAVGDTECIDIPIVNTTGRTVTLDSMQVGTYYPPKDDWFYSLPTFPTTLHVGDTAYIHLCYHALHYNRIDYSGNPLALIAISYSDSAHLRGGVRFTATASTPRSITFAQDTIRVNDVLVDGYTDVTFNIYHRSDSVVSAKFKPWLWSDNSLFYDEFHLMSDSVQLHQFDTIPVTVRFAPYEVGTAWAMVEYYQGSYPNSPVIIGRAIAASSDSLGLFTPPEESVLTLQTQSSVVTRTFYFTNNSGADLTVTAVSLSSGSHFQITGMIPSTLPALLANGDELAVSVQFNGDTTGFYRDSLIITTEHSLISAVFELQALRQPASRVAGSIADEMELTLSPTPAHNELTVRVRASDKVSYELLDLLGARVAQGSGTGTWKTSLAELPPGSYVLRASGADRNGKPFVASRMFIKR